jgi:mRNA-degrading endonuclease RelE of RelBE toxin-antitoxin system
MGRYTVIWSDEAKAERADLRSFYRLVLERSVRVLEDQAEVEALHRKPLNREEPLSNEDPGPIWELRVGQHRVLYSVEGRIVRVLRAILKGRKTPGESL